MGKKTELQNKIQVESGSWKCDQLDFDNVTVLYLKPELKTLLNFSFFDQKLWTKLLSRMGLKRDGSIWLDRNKSVP